MVYAKDDKCADNEIMYYISTSPITDVDAITSWSTYEPGKIVEIDLVGVTSTNVFYAVFKDSAGNVSK